LDMAGWREAMVCARGGRRPAAHPRYAGRWDPGNQTLWKESKARKLEPAYQRPEGRQIYHKRLVNERNRWLAATLCMEADSLKTFKEQGFVILRDVLPTTQVDAWREQAWEPLAINPDDVCRSWPDGGVRNTKLFKPEYRGRLRFPYSDAAAVSDPVPLSPQVGQQPQVKAILDFLLGPGTYDAGIAAPGEQGHGLEQDVVVFNWPHRPEERGPDLYNGVDQRNRGGGHIEGYRGFHKGGPTPQWQVGVTLYLDDVEPGGGATFVWPRSHLAVHRYFRNFPGDLPSGGAICTSRPEGDLHGIPPPRQNPTGQGMTEHYMRDFLPGGYDGGEPYEAVMRKGDIMIWHHWCVHASSYNGTDKVRQAIISRFHSTLPHHPLLWDDGGVASDGCLWKYWSDAVQGGESACRYDAVSSQDCHWRLVAGPQWQGPIWHKL
jgi:hypothetical protein